MRISQSRLSRLTSVTLSYELPAYAGIQVVPRECYIPVLKSIGTGIFFIFLHIENNIKSMKGLKSP